jgi:Protein of unknown function (DUF3159)
MTDGPADGPDTSSAVAAEGPAEKPLGSGPASGGRSSMLADAIGGPRGLIDGGVPALVFVTVNAASSLSPAIYAALGVGVLLVAIRLLRREPVQQAVGGFFALALAAFVASRTHRAEGFFLPGILYQGVLAAAATVSIIVRRPYIGYVMAALDPRYAHWRRDPRLYRAMQLATVVWGFVFLSRCLIQGALYLAHHPGWLAIVNIVMGWPLFASSLAISYLLARRAAPAVAADEIPADDEDRADPLSTPQRAG